MNALMHGSVAAAVLAQHQARCITPFLPYQMRCSRLHVLQASSLLPIEFDQDECLFLSASMRRARVQTISTAAQISLHVQSRPHSPACRNINCHGRAAACALHSRSKSTMYRCKRVTGFCAIDPACVPPCPLDRTIVGPNWMWFGNVGTSPCCAPHTFWLCIHCCNVCYMAQRCCCSAHRLVTPCA